MFTRALDPVIPRIAVDLDVEVSTAALLSTAFTLPYALAQPILGPIADMIGKTRIMTMSLFVVSVAAILSSMATAFGVVLVLRVMAGLVAGGVFPMALAIAGDLVPVNQRQVAIARLLLAGMLGNMLGASVSGVLGDLVGWRGVFACTGAFGLMAAGGAFFALRGVTTSAAQPFDLRAIPRSWRKVLANPLAKFCYGSVFLEGIFVFGLFPYVALLLFAEGETRTSIAGLVVAGFAAGGAIYALTASVLVANISSRSLVVAGGILSAGAMIVFALFVEWPVQFGAFMVIGFGLYLLHGFIQVQVTELVPTMRGAAMSLHSSSYFMGQAAGPVVYGFAFAQLGTTISIIGGAFVILAVAITCAIFLAARPSAP